MRVSEIQAREECTREHVDDDPAARRVDLGDPEAAKQIMRELQAAKIALQGIPIPAEQAELIQRVIVAAKRLGACEQAALTTFKKLGVRP